MLLPVGSAFSAPTGKLRTTSIHKLESGIQASICGNPACGDWPSIRPAWAEESPSVISTSAQRPWVVKF